jgi:hypothetical protein
VSQNVTTAIFIANSNKTHSMMYRNAKNKATLKPPLSASSSKFGGLLPSRETSKTKPRNVFLLAYTRVAH